ncbi:hypothetical protein [Kitasatospora sp. NPDC057198]|uniref:hypothetical protein n=1 Tax=Kitasatospora sp. NPDC057198 TaxID=3346046 RepID=UPI003630D69E
MSSRPEPLNRVPRHASGVGGGPCDRKRERGPAGQSPFIVSDEYAWAQVDDPVAAAGAVLGLLRA